MSPNAWRQMILFVGILVILSIFFHPRISIVGSLILTLVVNLVLAAVRSKR